MEVQRPAYYPNGYDSCQGLDVPYRSSRYQDYERKCMTSCSLYGVSILPQLVDNARYSKRTEKIEFTSSARSAKIIRASKHGYHRRGNSPTFKVLKEVSEKLQQLVDRQMSQKTSTDYKLPEDASHDEISDDECENDSYVFDGATNTSGLRLDLKRYTTDSSPCESLTSTPLPFRVISSKRPNTELHLFLPRLSDDADNFSEADDSAKLSLDKGDYQENIWCHVPLGWEKKPESKRSTTFPNLNSKTGQKKTKSKKSKLPTEGNAKDQSTGKTKQAVAQTGLGLPDINSGEANINENQSKHFDFLNDIATLISEERDLLQFSEASYVLPELEQTADCVNRTDSSRNVDREKTGTDIQCSTFRIAEPNGMKFYDDYTVCTNIHNRQGNFVDRLYQLVINEEFHSKANKTK